MVYAKVMWKWKLGTLYCTGCSDMSWTAGISSVAYAVYCIFFYLFITQSTVFIISSVSWYGNFGQLHVECRVYIVTMSIPRAALTILLFQ
jgi:hypothetical protein